MTGTETPSIVIPPLLLSVLARVGAQRKSRRAATGSTRGGAGDVDFAADDFEIDDRIADSDTAASGKGALICDSPAAEIGRIANG